jgi:Mn2+/Fe2+ NRAMP family transporter
MADITGARTESKTAPVKPNGSNIITHEDVDRARDRLAVARAREPGVAGHRRSLRLFWLFLGPGVLVFLGENDAPSMLSYSATGAKFGVGFFVPFILLTFLMAYVVQEMTVRLGAVTHRGHAEVIFDRFGKFWGWFAMSDLALGNFLTLVTEFIGVRAGLSFFGFPPAVSVGGAVIIVFVVVATHRYWTWERIVLGLAIFNGLFVPAALLAHPQWGAIGHAFLTWTPIPEGGLLKPDTILILVADIGATVTPWMLFFQQSAVTDKGLQPRDIRNGRIDTLVGTFLAAAFGIATVVAAAPLFAKGIDASSYQAGEFAQALVPLIGRVGATLFALGIFEAGLVAAITISASSAYAFGEVAKAPHSLNRPLREGKDFYGILMGSVLVAGALVLIPHVPLEYFVLIVNVIAVLALPPALLFLVLLSNDKAVMGEHTNSPLSNVAIIAVTVILVIAGIGFGLTTIFPHLLGGGS